MPEILKLSGCLLPKALPGESPMSLAIRFFSGIGSVSTEKFLKSVFGKNIQNFANANITKSFSDPTEAFNMSSFVYYMSVLPEDEQTGYKDAIINKGKAGLVAKSKNFNSPYLKSCPLCVEWDTEQYGTPYFHAVHEFAGLDVCPFHGCYLVEHKGHSFNEIFKFKAEPVVFAPEREQSLARLVPDLPGLDAERLDGSVRAVLKGQGYYSGSKWNLQKLYEHYKNFYGNGFMKRFALDKEAFRSSFSRVKSDKLASNPFFILTLVNMLGLDMEHIKDFTPETRQEKVKEEMPEADCKNPFCENKRLLPVCCDSHGKYTYRCEKCNMVFTPTKILQYGRAFKAAVEDYRKTHTWDEVAAFTGIARQTLYRITNGTTDTEKIDHKVEAARKTARSCPSLGELAEKHYKDYYTLQHFDRDWLESHYEPNSTRRETSRKRMAAKDNRLYARLVENEEASSVYDGTLNFNYFCQLIGLTNSESLRKNYPKCYGYINAHVETAYEGYLRKGRLYLDSVPNPFRVKLHQFMSELSSTDDCRRAYFMLMEEYKKRERSKQK